MAKKPPKAKAADTPPPDDADDAAAELPTQPAPAPPVSVPAKASCLTFLVLLLAEVIILSVILFRGEAMFPGWGWIALVTLLVFVIPIVVYRAVALWMFDEIARFPDIAGAWRSGIVELERQGISLHSAPLFIVVGTGDDKLRRSFMNAADSDYRVDAAADAPGPLHWYANDDGIFLYLNDASWMNAAVTLYEIHAAAAKSGRQLPGEVPAAATGGRRSQQYMGTLVPGALSAAPQPAASTGLPSDGDALAGAHQVSAPAAKGQGPAPAAGGPNAGQYFGTLTPDQVVAPATPSGDGANAPSGAVARPAPPTAKRASNRLNSQEAGHQLQRLENVCGMLRRYRHPVCPANGILTLLPFGMLKAGDQDVAELERAISADLTTIYRELQLRCPVTAVVVGMEQERGFRELIRRIGREGATKQRFGQRFDVRVRATEEELQKFSSHVCGTFEDWVYTLFREDQALSHPGNTSLYALLCKVRRTMKARLGDVLGKGFGCDRQETEAPVLFSGCYFTATGPKSDRQAFVRGLLGKLYDEQEDIEWTAEALREDRRRGWLATIGWAVCAIIVLFMAAWFLWDWYSGTS